MKNILIFGASGHGCVVMDCIEAKGIYNILGFIDSFLDKGSKKFGYTILGNEYDLPQLMEKHSIYGGIVAIGDNWIRHLMVQRILKIAKDFRFISVTHPSSIVGTGVVVGKGSVIMPGAIINPFSTLGDFCIVNTNASLGHEGHLHDYSSLSPGVCTGGNFTLGKFSAVSLGARIIENIAIGANTVIGAGSLVLNNICDLVMAYGSPAVVVRKRVVGEGYLGNKGILTNAVFIREPLAIVNGNKIGIGV